MGHVWVGGGWRVGAQGQVRAAGWMKKDSGEETASALAHPYGSPHPATGLSPGA